MSKRKISGWGNYPKIEAEFIEPLFTQEVNGKVLNSKTILARGNGRSYGDAALNDKVLSTLKLNCLLGFDNNSGILECESGVLLSIILDFIVPKAYFLPVTPGTKFITVGGAIASDVHGKNHHKNGCFSNFVLSFNLVDQHGVETRCSREENSTLFWQTIGGMGLTGVITSAKISLLPIETAFISQEVVKAQNLDEIMNLFELSTDWTYTVAWIDCFRSGKDIGRSLLFRGEHAKLHELPKKLKRAPLYFKKKGKINVPFNPPSFMLNKFTISVFNFFIYHKNFKKRKKSIVSYDKFFYPLDGIHNWNRIYGKSGFIQYQFVIPKEKSRKGLELVLNEISKSGQGSFLAVLKLFGKENKNALHTFPMEGYTLALDFKVNSKLPQLVDRLDDIVEELGGKIYLAKDAMSRSTLFSYFQCASNDKFDSYQKKRINQNPKG